MPTDLYKKWDTYFHITCESISTKSQCLSRKIGAILVRDNSIISTGYNGPPRGIPHCGHERLMVDKNLQKVFSDKAFKTFSRIQLQNTCPRKILEFESGKGMQWCTAQHAEENAITNAARNGVSVVGTTLYMNCVIPCMKCFGTLINAGIIEIVVDDDKFYDNHTQFLIENSNIKIRRFEL